ncbi:MAG TPA: hypothetical protein VGN08_00765 [Solirubrobacteraceae bacterium]
MGDSRRRLQLAVLTVAMLLVALSSATAASAQTPWLKLASVSTPTNLPPGGEGTINLTATNLGDGNLEGNAESVTVTDTVPQGFEITGAKPATCLAESGREGKAPEKPVCIRKWPGQPKTTVKDFPPCTFTPSTATCTLSEILAPYERWEMSINVRVPNIPSGSKPVNELKVAGGKLAEPKILSRPLTVSSEPTPFAVENLELTPENEVGAPQTQAGSHPFQFTTALDLNRIYQLFPTGNVEPSVPASPKDLKVNLPPGLIGNASKGVIPQCTELQFTTTPVGGVNQCPADTAVGAAVVTVTEPDNVKALTVPTAVYNLVPAPGEPARFGFLASIVPVTIDTVVREGDYHVVANVNNASQEAALLSSEVTIWGIPGDPAHDQSRGSQCIAREALLANGEKCVLLNNQHPEPFITMPGSCETPLQTSVQAESWLPGATFLEPFVPAASQTMTGCDHLPFTPTITLQPTQSESNTPTGLTVNLEVPQPSTHDVKGLAEANIRNTEVKFPTGIQLSPSAANGLTSCGLAEIGFVGQNQATKAYEFSPVDASCPDSSKVGNVEITTPVLEHPLHGSVYLAAQESNPANSRFGVYLVVEDPITGVLVKIFGTVEPDPTTGQITSKFENAPQLPFEKLSLELFSGPRASLATPRTCGNYATLAKLGPWSGQQEVESASGFTIGSGPHGTGCAGPLPFNPSFQAGTNRQAGAFTPFTLTLARADTDQSLTHLSMTLPPGIAGLLSQVKQCPEPQASQGTCGPESLIGSATAVAGLGPEPFTVTGGRVYITGPYHGAPFGLSVVIPAKAGPFDFGYVVTRSTINVDRSTAALTIDSELPTMLNALKNGVPQNTGVPVQLRQVVVTVERPGGAPFQFNPTNCSPMRITGAISGDEGASTPISYPFQAVNCEKLPFAPTLSAETSSNVTKLNGTSLVVKVTSGAGQANIAKTKIEFPEQLPSRLTTIQKACPDSVFEANPATCPEGSVIGTATAHTPVLNSPLTGPAYLVSHGGAAFPDAEFVLQGEGITLILDGQTDIKKGITSSTFNAVPDAPVSSFVVTLPAGPHSAFTGFGDLCKPTTTVTKRVKVAKKVRSHGRTRTTHVFKNVQQTIAAPLMMPTVLTGQNGNTIVKKTPLTVTGCKAVQSFKAKHKAKKKSKKKKKSSKKKKK